MELSKCFGCMEDFQGYPCPNCGYDPAKDKHMEYALPPETILAGKYMAGRVLGQGGFGITYIGWDIALERKVAIKEYYPSGQVSRSPGTRNLTWYSSEQSLHARQDGMQMFLKEARKMSRADGIPGVVRVLDLFQENGTAYIVMEFIEGVTLKAKLQQTGPLPWEQVRELFLSVIQTMAQVHKAGLVHRDLSPDNIMLLPNGGVKILDLGAAKDLSINSGASSMQVAKSGFSPLEQYTQRGGSGPWTDVYSMAATIYYTLTGKLPPNAIDRMDKDTLSWDFSALNQLPAQAREALQKAMMVIAKDRLQTMDELGVGLLVQEITQPEVKNPEPKEPEPKPEPAPKTKKKSKKLIWIAAAAVVAVLCGTLIWGNLRSPAMAYKRAQTLMAAERYEEAIEMYHRAANQGLAAAQNDLGECYYNGNGVTTDYGEAVKWYRLAADQGYADAQSHLGDCYYQGNGVTQDYDEAVKWYRLAAEQENASAQSMLGVCYYNGDGVPQDYEEAVKWFRLAADQGLASAQDNLGVCYWNGEGVPQDYTEAVKWFRLVADQGYASAQNDLGNCYRDGSGVTQDYAEAVKWYRLAAEQENASAQNMLGVCYYNGDGVPQDYEEAVRWFRLAADQGLATAQSNLGSCYRDGCGVTQDYKEAVKWYRLAADQGYANAQSNLGNCYYHGIGVTQDYDEAVKWYRLAADQGFAAAQYSLGACYCNGQGVPKDYTEAVKWFRLAAEQGYAEAQRGLAYCYEEGWGVQKDKAEAQKWYDLADAQE